jgi:hypothetical protein
VLPKDGTVPVSAVGPTFWWGGTVTDPNPHSLFGQAFLEVQFYPDAIVNTCSSDGGFNVTYAPNKFSVCSPAWQVTTTSKQENAAFNAELFNGLSNHPLVMNQGVGKVLATRGRRSGNRMSMVDPGRLSVAACCEAADGQRGECC